MAQRFLTPINLTGNELQNVRLQSLSSDPASLAGKIYFNTSVNRIRYFNGTSWVDIQDAGGVTSVAGASPITVSAATGAVTISILAATDAIAGSMSPAHFSLLNGATALNTINTLVRRDGLGNFAAGTITANLAGTASNSDNLGNQPGSHYLNRANHTGTQTAATISNFDTQVRTSRLDQMAAPTTAVGLNGQRITNLAEPTAATDAATRAYVDAARMGMDFKESARLATTANITLSGLAAIDGVTPAAGNRVLVKDQSTPAQNGIYVAASGAWARAADAATSAQVTPGMFVFVEEGTVNADTGWVLSTNAPITLGTTPLAFVQFSGAGQIVAGDGLNRTANIISAIGTPGRISIGAGIDIAPTYIGQTSITTLGTVTTGTWNAAAVPVAHGGTGATTAAAARTNLGAVSRFAQTIGDGSTVNFPVNHNLGTQDVHVSIYEVATPHDVVHADVEHTSINQVTVRFSPTPPATNQYRVVVIG